MGCVAACLLAEGKEAAALVAALHKSKLLLQEKAAAFSNACLLGETGLCMSLCYCCREAAAISKDRALAIGS